MEDEPKKKSWVGRHKVLTTLGIIVAFFIVIGVATSLGGNKGAIVDTPAGTPAQTGKGKAAKSKRLNPAILASTPPSPTVTSNSRSRASTAARNRSVMQISAKNAQGEYCFVNRCWKTSILATR